MERNKNRNNAEDNLLCVVFVAAICLVAVCVLSYSRVSSWDIGSGHVMPGEWLLAFI
jgi:hypothetical protein